MKLLESLTTVGLLRRLLATLRSIDRSQRRLAQAAEDQLAIECLRAGIKPSKLREALADAEAADGKVELLTQSEEELATLERLRSEAEARGVRVREEDDLRWLGRELEKELDLGERE